MYILEILEKERKMLQGEIRISQTNINMNDRGSIPKKILSSGSIRPNSEWQTIIDNSQKKIDLINDHIKNHLT
jgi:hypothetical protein